MQLLSFLELILNAADILASSWFTQYSQSWCWISFLATSGHQETRTFSTSYFLAGADGMGDTVTDEGCGTNSFQVCLFATCQWKDQSQSVAPLLSNHASWFNVKMKFCSLSCSFHLIFSKQCASFGGYVILCYIAWLSEIHGVVEKFPGLIRNFWWKKRGRNKVEDACGSHNSQKVGRTWIVWLKGKDCRNENEVENEVFNSSFWYLRPELANRFSLLENWIMVINDGEHWLTKVMKWDSRFESFVETMCNCCRGFKIIHFSRFGIVNLQLNPEVAFLVRLWYAPDYTDYDAERVGTVGVSEPKSQVLQSFV